MITICKYDEYNPVKGKVKGEEKGVDNSNEIKELHAALGELREELRAILIKKKKTLPSLIELMMSEMKLM